MCFQKHKKKPALNTLAFSKRKIRSYKTNPLIFIIFTSYALKTNTFYKLHLYQTLCSSFAQNLFIYFLFAQAKSFTTSPARIRPATDGTNAIEPGVALLLLFSSLTKSSSSIGSNGISFE